MVNLKHQDVKHLRIRLCTTTFMFVGPPYIYYSPGLPLPFCCCTSWARYLKWLSGILALLLGYVNGLWMMVELKFGDVSSVVFLWSWGVSAIHIIHPHQRQPATGWSACIPFPIDHESHVVEWQTSHGTVHAEASPESSLADIILPDLLSWGPAGILPLHPKPLAASLCCLQCSFDGRALAPDS